MNVYAREHVFFCSKKCIVFFLENVIFPLPEVAENKSKETWMVGMFCRAIFHEDRLEYEGTIESGHQV